GPEGSETSQSRDGGLAPDEEARYRQTYRSGRRLTVDGTHRSVGVARTRGGSQILELRHVGARHRHGEGADVFFDIFPPLGPRDRHDVVPFRKEPGERQLARRTALRACERFDPSHEVEVLLKILALKPRMIAAPIAVLDVFGTLDLAGEKAAAQWTIRDETDAELAHRGEDLLLHVAAPERVFRLQGRDGVHGVPAPHRLRRRLRQPEE